MPTTHQYNNAGLNLNLSPFLHNQGEMIRLVNVTRDSYGAWKKRPGYTTYLNDVNGTITKLLNFTLNNGTQFWNYAVTGGSLLYSTQGTGNWTICGNGTLTNGAQPGNAVIDNTMILGDGTANSRHTTTGTSFTDTTGAPKAQQWADYQGRIYAGTSSTLFWSTTGTATDWTTDSSSIQIPGPGAINWVAKVADRIVTAKNSGIMHRWDGFNLVDLTTNLGPTSAQSVGNVEDFRLYLNRVGAFGFGGGKPEIISNVIERQIYNDSGSAIAGGTFDSAPGAVYKYDWYAAVGTITDDLTNETLSNAVLCYDFQLNEWRNYSLSDNPTAWLNYKDASGNEQLIFGDTGGQCYTFGGTALSDNGKPITSVIEYVINGGSPNLDKKWNYDWFFFNPGCQAVVQVAYANTFATRSLNWVNLGQAVDGVVEFKHSDARSRLMFVKITESSMSARFQFFGHSSDSEIIERR